MSVPWRIDELFVPVIVKFPVVEVILIFPAFPLPLPEIDWAVVVEILILPQQQET